MVDIDKDKMLRATERVIEVLRKELNLEPWECYFVLKIMYESFPEEYIPIIKEEKRNGRS